MKPFAIENNLKNVFSLIGRQFHSSTLRRAKAGIENYCKFKAFTCFRRLRSQLHN